MIHKKTLKKSSTKIALKKTKKLKTQENKTINKKVLNNIINKLEFTILIHIISDQILFLIKTKVPKDKIKNQIIVLLNKIRNNNKLIKNNITENELNIIFDHIYK